MTERRNILRRPLHIISTHRRAYLIINAIVYGLLLAGFVTALVFPALGATRVDALEDDGSADLVRSLVMSPWLFAIVILGVNVVTAAGHILLPSLIVPFAGIAVFGYKAFTLGLGLAPDTDIAAVGLIPHSLTALIEFQAYALLVLGAYLLGKAWLRPASVGARTRRQGYLRGLRQVGWLGLPALALFVVGAIYEAFSLRYLVHPLAELLL